MLQDSSSGAPLRSHALILTEFCVGLTTSRLCKDRGILLMMTDAVSALIYSNWRKVQFLPANVFRTADEDTQAFLKCDFWN